MISFDSVSKGVWLMIHILPAEKGDDVATVQNAAKTRKPVSWIVSKGTHAGEQVLFHLPALGLAARGVIGTEPKDRGQGYRYFRYTATVRKIALLDRPLSLAFLRKNHPSWGWPNGHLGRTTIDGRIEARLEELLENSPKTPEPPGIEGGSRPILLTVYERDPKARDRCLKHYGTDCHGCGFSFGKTYGEIAKEYIHVHHLEAVSGRGGEYEVDPIRDLRPLCPNCHAVVHLEKPPISILKLKRMLKAA